MRNLNGWKGYLTLSIVLFLFALIIIIDFWNDLPNWFRGVGFSFFIIISGGTLRESKELYKKSKK